jgi:hypothetical protein
MKSNPIQFQYISMGRSNRQIQNDLVGTPQNAIAHNS